MAFKNVNKCRRLFSDQRLVSSHLCANTASLYRVANLLKVGNPWQRFE